MRNIMRILVVLIVALISPALVIAGSVKIIPVDHDTLQTISDATIKDSSGNIIAVGECVPDGSFTISAQGYWTRKFSVSTTFECSAQYIHMYSTKYNPFQHYQVKSGVHILPGGTTTLQAKILQRFGTNEGFENFRLEISHNEYISIVKVVVDGVEVSQDVDGLYYVGTQDDTSVFIEVTVKGLSSGLGRVTIVPHGTFNGQEVGTSLTGYLYVYVDDPNSSSSSSSSSSTRTTTTSTTLTSTLSKPPFSVQMPSGWQVGQNELRIINTKAESYVLVLSLRDASGSEVWSDSYGFSAYEAKTFYIEIPREGTYTLSIFKDGTEYKYDIEVSSTFKLISKEIYASGNETAEVIVQLKNNESETKYYTVSISNEMLNLSKNKTVQLQPGQEITVSIPFQVPADPTYDAYNILVQVGEGDNIVYEANAILKIQNEFQVLPIAATCGPGISVLLALLVAFVRRGEK